MAGETIFQKVARRSAKAGIDEMSPRQAMNWFRAQADKVGKVDRTALFSTAGHKVNNQRSLNQDSIGRCFMFYYDPKHKATLPYYDRFPLIFLVDEASDHFTGLNLHYLPKFLRAKLMDALYTLINDKTKTSNAKLVLSYQVLKGASKFKLFAPCFKMYLKKHVMSSFYAVDSQFWDFALFLPTESFQKKNKNFVWTESAGKVYGKR